MNIHVYTVCYNEEIMLPYFLRHYEMYAEKIIVYDNGSNDRSCEIARAHPSVELRTFDTNNELNDVAITALFNECYKESRGAADFVIVCAVDEFVHHPNLVEQLERAKALRITLPFLTGIDMVSDAPPSGDGQIYDEIKCGVPNHDYSKMALFDPRIDMQYEIGCHMANPMPRDLVQVHETDIKLLHYALLGEKYLCKKNAMYRARMSDINKRFRLGWHRWDDNTTITSWKQKMKYAEVVV